ncbi:alpha/beta hydrolase [Paraburkholderia sp. EG287B]|uniref:alpha/beta hydrolase n=1 Tax=unclassified Paraburkholderia TaxID=2615204 RepID=UPI0034D30DD8
MGPKVDPFETAHIYAPMQERMPAEGIAVQRDVAYGAGEKENVDVFTPVEASRPRPILIFVHGGAFRFDDKSRTPDGRIGPFYDNVMIWAVKHGMVGVNMNYTLAPKAAYPVVQREIAQVVAWARSHATALGADPQRIVLWGHSAGASHVASFLAHPEVYRDVEGATEPVSAAVLSSGIYTLRDPSVNVYFGPPETAIGRASVNGLVASAVPLLITSAEFDPQAMIDEAQHLDAALTAAGRNHAMLVAKQHGHMSEIYSVDTSDQTLTGPVLEFISRHVR